MISEENVSVLHPQMLTICGGECRARQQHNPYIDRSKILAEYFIQAGGGTKLKAESQLGLQFEPKNGGG